MGWVNVKAASEDGVNVRVYFWLIIVSGNGVNKVCSSEDGVNQTPFIPPPSLQPDHVYLMEEGLDLWYVSSSLCFHFHNSVFRLV